VSTVRYIHDDIVVVGWSCRFPGANSVPEFWSLLLEGRCAVSRVPEDRFLLQRFGHPRRNERGKSYTWAAGVIDDVWGFDPAVFGISPREAEQMDPQQRILLELTWEALEDAGIPPSSIAGSETGVFVGGSLVEYANNAVNDPAIVDSHFGTGNALAVLSNRISHVFDLRGPSLTIDTACSSSLVALHQAAEAIRSGRIDTAIVGGINVIGNHTSFILFSQASMLSPTGLCRAFDANADGFVRAEGGAVFVLRRAALANAKSNPIRGVILASDVNSDGRTNGIALPSVEAQENLLSRVYSRAAIAPARLAFVEAHGTGTAAGDPIEATALGHVLGRQRDEALPIGSVKTNIGHLEPASGMAGVVKSLLALNHGMLPRSLHFSEPNPNIDFPQLNLAVCTEPLLLPNVAQQCAGVNSFGFGGTNAHVVLAPGRAAGAMDAAHRSDPARYLTISAESAAALRTLARDYATRVAALPSESLPSLASAAAYRRERMANRLVVSLVAQEEVVSALHAAAEGAEHPHLTASVAIGRDLAPAFVYSGNGSQWVGMGMAAYRHNAAFRKQFDEVDSLFQGLAGWPLREAMFSDELGDRLNLTSVAQPLIFAIQSAATAALRARGLTPSIVLGHSVGEIAAAEAAGALDCRSAVRVIYYRSKHQEAVRGAGRMAVINAPPDVAADLAHEIPGVEVAAINSPRAATMAGTGEAIAQLRALAKTRNIAFVDLGLDYPFHNSLLAEIEEKLVAELGTLAPRDAAIPFISTVSGSCVAGSQLHSLYWWRNIREPVRFMDSIREAAKLGARFFVEIGPSPTLVKHIGDTLSGQVTGYATLPALERDLAEIDPFDCIIAKALASGARLDDAAVFGTDTGEAVSLPFYPWQHTQFRYTPTVEGRGTSESERHPLAGARCDSDALEWFSHVDTALLPDLADHKVGDQVILPGTAFIEIAFSVARQWLKARAVTIADFEILKPLDLTSGESREVMTRVSPGSNTLEILSRPRLSRGGWTLNCRGKMLHGHAPAECVAFAAAGARRLAGNCDLYALAGASGLHYGPAFRLIREISADQRGTIHVDLEPAISSSPYLLDPARLDCCVQGMITVFDELRAPERGVAYIPVRLDEATLVMPGDLPHSANLRLRRKSERSLLVDCDIMDAGGALIAAFRGVRCQAVPVRRQYSLESTATVEILQPADGSLLGRSGLDATAAEVLADAEELGLLAPAAADAGMQLLEGWATAAAYEIARGLSKRGRLDPLALVDAEAVPRTLQPWLMSLLRNLEAAGLAREADGRWSLARNPELPPSSKIIAAIAGEYPMRAPELLAASELTRLADQVAETKRMPRLNSLLTPAMLDFFAAADETANGAVGVLAQLLRVSKRLLPAARAIRVLQLGAGPGGHAIAARAAAGDIHLTLFEPDGARLDRMKMALPRSPNIAVVRTGESADLGVYDVAVAADGLSRLAKALPLERLRQAIAGDGLLIAVERQPSVFLDLVFGLGPDWFADGTSDFPAGPLRTEPEWRSMLDRAGFGCCKTAAVQCGPMAGTLLVAESRVADFATARHASRSPITRASLLLDRPTARDQQLAASLARMLQDKGLRVDVVDGEPVAFSAGDGHVFVQFLSSADEPGDFVERLTEQCFAMRNRARQMPRSSAKLWLAFQGAFATGAERVRPAARGAWTFSRTLANEFPQLDIRRVDIASGMAADTAAARLCDIILSDSAETELRIEENSIFALRADTITRAIGDSDRAATQAARLHHRPGAGQRLHWAAEDRTSPRETEIEIAVDATGLNFRDVLLTLSLLPDDILEHGFAGPTLGLECAGRVTRVGSAVDGFCEGDRVVALAAGSFATHVTVPTRQAVHLPDQLSCEAAATIPVAFMTAYYALLTQARLKRGEWVLIHAGAGGVGLAAIQIAQARGAKIIATAGSSTKRAFLRSLGVRHVLDSRSTEFADEVRRITGSGVDVVLNSLAGEAMERSLACLKSFGRFIELGKRDYISNTHLGLRPFRRNLTYFGIDIDQLVGRGDAGQKLFAQVMRRFRIGTLKPLPYTVFDADRVAEAFHLVQQSAHIGKIVIRPPQPDAVRRPSRPFSVSGGGTHLITGGLGGFGLEAAKWLADKGARHLVLVGRRGLQTPGAHAAVEALHARGVEVKVEPLDVSDYASMKHLVGRIGATMPPLVGVIHAAMVLDDAIIANLDRVRMHRVLDPKVKGADHLDRLTRNLTLDYFVLFSSVTTLIGNPGQGNYVAANGYMEGLARRRRQDGLPALAIGWGPINDVGAVARDEKLQKGLEQLTGARGMAAREALELMAQALALSAGRETLAVMAIAPNDGDFGGGRLPVLRSPSFAALAGKEASPAGPGVAKIDLRELLKSEDEDAVRRKIGAMITAQLAKVLHFRPEDVSPTRPLAEIGLDSLMGLELGMNLESAFGVQFSAIGSVGAMTIASLADTVMAQAGTSEPRKTATVIPIVRRHAEVVEPEQLEVLTELMRQPAAARQKG
jgi:phthiocerol/phenolphthiocerol synthesis type-I polyketide synthase C